MHEAHLHRPKGVWHAIFSLQVTTLSTKVFLAAIPALTRIVLSVLKLLYGALHRQGKVNSSFTISRDTMGCHQSTARWFSYSSICHSLLSFPPCALLIVCPCESLGHLVPWRVPPHSTPWRKSVLADNGHHDEINRPTCLQSHDGRALPQQHGSVHEVP